MAPAVRKESDLEKGGHTSNCYGNGDLRATEQEP